MLLRSYSGSEFICESSSLSYAIRLINIADGKHTGNKNFPDDCPLVQCGCPLKRNADTIQDGYIVFFTAGNQSTFFSRNIFSADDKRE